MRPQHSAHLADLTVRNISHLIFVIAFVYLIIDNSDVFIFHVLLRTVKLCIASSVQLKIIVTLKLKLMLLLFN